MERPTALREREDGLLKIPLDVEDEASGVLVEELDQERLHGPRGFAGPDTSKDGDILRRVLEPQHDGVPAFQARPMAKGRQDPRGLPQPEAKREGLLPGGRDDARGGKREARARLASGAAVHHAGEEAEHQGRGQPPKHGCAHEPPAGEQRELAHLAQQDTGQPDEDQAKGELGPKPHVRHARSVGAPAQEPAQGPPRAAEYHAPHAETQGVAEALDPGFAEGEEHPEEPPPEAPEEPGRGSRPRWSEQRRETAWDWPSCARGPQGMEEARVVRGSCR